MMKPDVVDVIEYVKAGEDDPKMAEMLDLHPDGQQLLKQARFICKMLQHQAESMDDGEIAADVSRVASFQIMDSLHEPNVTYRQSLRAPRSMVAELRSFLGGGGTGDGEDLGTLEFTDDGDTVSISYTASESVKVRYGKPFKKDLFAQTGIQGIEIRGRGINISLPDAFPATGAVTILVTAGERQMPAQGLPVIFMPDAGPFVRLRVDSDGALKLPVRGQAGTLRVETDPPQHLSIQRRE